MMRLIEMKFPGGWYCSIHGETLMSAIQSTLSGCLELFGLTFDWYIYPSERIRYCCLTITFLGFSLDLTIGREKLRKSRREAYRTESDEEYERLTSPGEPANGIPLDSLTDDTPEDETP